MTEQECLDLSDRVRVSTMLNLFREIISESSSVIKQDDYESVGKILSRWETGLFEAVEVKESK